MKSLKGTEYPATKAQILAVATGKTIDGWEVGYFLAKSLRNKRYETLRSVMTDLETWLDEQG